MNFINLSMVFAGSYERSLINSLPMSSHEDVVYFATKQRLARKGIGWIDVHLLHSCWVNKAGILTLDKNLKKMASSLRIKT